MKVFEFQGILKRNRGTKYSPTNYFSSTTQKVTNDLDIDVSLKSSYQTILPRIQKWFVGSSG